MFLDRKQVAAMLIAASQAVEESRDLLNEADRMGDGDHGLGMARGFREARRRLEERRSGDAQAEVGALFETVGMAVMSAAGGAAGAVFGTLFRAGAKALAEAESLDGPGLARVLSQGLSAVKARGGAQPGDKTMVDALEPAALAAGGQEDIVAALEAAAMAAEGGAESTRSMTARVGKMKSLGERSLGHPDPGALSLAIVLRAMSRFAGGGGTRPVA